MCQQVAHGASSVGSENGVAESVLREKVRAKRFLAAPA
jgi:hypothetical protein